VSSNALLVLTTCAGAEEARRLAGALVERRLAACVSTVNQVASTYWWQGRIEHDSESVLLIKSTEERFGALEAAIRELSSYDVPEVLAMRVDAGSAAYLDWLVASVQPEGTGPQ
jgi:periplasmic divalent cation tolerance protein